MTNGNERLDRIEALLERFVVASDERLTRIEQVVESNNRFLESFSRNLQQYATSMDNLTKRIDGVVASNNEQRDETNSRLSSIQRQVIAISQHLGVNQ